ncbi:MAG: CapA family protein [Actinobacteria bacterium]|nr:CapA family protein [Actinomycetota bacterium]
MLRRRTTLLCVALVTAGATVAATAAAAPGSISGTPATASSPAQRLDPPPRTLLVALGGDILNESAVNLAGAAAAGPGERYDFAPLFAPVAPVIAAADLAICHAELPIGAPGERPGLYGRSPFGGNLLLAPYELAQASPTPASTVAAPRRTTASTPGCPASCRRSRHSRPPG